MKSQIYKPKGNIASYVDFFWFQRGYDPSYLKEKILPAGSVQLIINLDETAFRVFGNKGVLTFTPSILTGLQHKGVVIDSKSRCSTMGVQFSPGGVGAVLHVKACELEGSILSLSCLLGGRKAEVLYSRLLEADLVQQKFLILEQFLSSMCENNYMVHSATALALSELQSLSSNDNDDHGILELSKQAGLSLKRFTEVFHDEVGLTPKRYSRIRRFQHVLTRLNTTEKVDGAALALNFGYYDQSHFIRDFKSFSGLTPTQYQAIRPEEKNHIPL